MLILPLSDDVAPMCLSFPTPDPPSLLSPTPNLCTFRHPETGLDKIPFSSLHLPNPNLCTFPHPETGLDKMQDPANPKPDLSSSSQDAWCSLCQTQLRAPPTTVEPNPRSIF
ncbi:hypothetical protein C1H46_017214 [Malus baccata]|uniref:Uncharacterized protein n=1 Tax=Malus baccata TaxID=106549 RepID=A0A540MEI0_MALBA|nr:hypothetical protein C1H46_017214 [Malus baccata]